MNNAKVLHSIRGDGLFKEYSAMNSGHKSKKDSSSGGGAPPALTNNDSTAHNKFLTLMQISNIILQFTFSRFYISYLFLYFLVVFCFSSHLSFF